MNTGTPLGRMVVELALDDADFGKGVKGASKQVTYLAKEMQANMKIADLAGNKMGVLGSKYDGLSKIIEAQEKKVSTLSKAYSESFDENGKATDATLRYANQLQQANGQLANYKKQLANTAGEMAEWKVRNEGLSGALNTFGRGLTTTGQYTEAFGKKLTVGVTAPVVAFTAGLVKMGLDVRKFRAQSQIFYEGLYQDTARAKQQLDDLMTFAKTTPYSYESLVQADMVMQTFGMSTDKAKVSLEAIANAIAATGGTSADLEKIATVFGQIESSGKLSLQDMNQLVNAKIPALKIVANELGMSVMNLRTKISKGEVSSEQAINALTKGLMEGTNGMNGATQAYSGALDKVKEQLPGAIDSLKSAFKNLALQLVDEEAFEKVIESINKITTMLKNGQFTPIIKSISNVLKDTVDMVGNLALGFSKLSPKTQESILKFIAFAAAAGPILTVTGKLEKGIGTVTTKTVGFLGVLAKKKTIAEFAGQLVSGSDDIVKWGKTATEGATATAGLGSAAAGASGTGGVAGLTGALGALGPVALSVIGAGGILAVGYGAWKLFGESAWNSSQRVDRWGTDVSAVTDRTLRTVKENLNLASGQFGLMEQGFSVNTTAMVENIETIGTTIEESLNNKISALQTMLAELPENFNASMKQIIVDELERSNTALAVVQENSQKISGIKQVASDNNRQLSIAEANMIKDLAKESTEAYVNSLDISMDEKEKMLKMMNGNVETASKEEAKIWFKSLAQQRVDVKEHIAELKKIEEKKLEEAGYNLNGEFAKTYLAAWEDAQNVTVEGIDVQLALIAQKYPELLDMISLLTGEVISGTAETQRYLLAENEKIISSSFVLSEKLAKNATDNASILKWTANQATEAGETWNSVIFDPITGEVKTNAREAVIEATKDVDTWNRLKPVIHDANLDTNAKSVLAEAAVANGYWDQLDWDEKQIILNDKFSFDMYNALYACGKWDDMTLEEKTMFLYSNTPETMAETMLQLGMWDTYNPAIKDINASNFNFLNILSQSEEKLNDWNNTPVEAKELFGENYDLLEKIYESDAVFSWWSQIPDNEKAILISNGSFLEKIIESEGSLNTWNSMPIEEKEMLIGNTDLLMKLLESEENLNRWNSLPIEEKQILGSNQDLMDKVITSEDKYKQWMALPEKDKKLLGDNSDLLEKVFSSDLKYKQWMALPDEEKFMLGTNTSFIAATAESSQALRDFNSTSTTEKNFLAIDNATDPAKKAVKAVNEFNTLKGGTVTLTAVTQLLTKGTEKHAKGTNFHSGGPAIVNDQSGPLFKELVMPKNGTPFIAEGRNVLLPDLPRGSKVLNATQTKRLIPKYANGIGGIPADAEIIKNLDYINNKSTVVRFDTIDYNRKLEKIILLLEKVTRSGTSNNNVVDEFKKALENVNIQAIAVINKSDLISETAPAIDRKLSINSMLKGRGI